MDQLVLHLMPGLVGSDLQAVGAVQQVAAQVDHAGLERDRPAAEKSGKEADLHVHRRELLARVHPVRRDLVFDDLREHGSAVVLGHLVPRRLDRGIIRRHDSVTRVESDTRERREGGRRTSVRG